MTPHVILATAKNDRMAPLCYQASRPSVRRICVLIKPGLVELGQLPDDPRKSKSKSPALDLSREASLMTEKRGNVGEKMKQS